MRRMKQKWIWLALLLTGAAGAQTITLAPANPSSPGTVGNLLSVTSATNGIITLAPSGVTAPNGALTALSVNKVYFADSYSGADCGAKINSALTAIGANPGNVQMTPACGSITTAVTLGTNQHIYARPGTYSQSAIITIGQNASVECDPASDAPGSGYGTCQFNESNGANLAEMFLLNGTNSALVNLGINGNYTNNSTAGPNIVITGLRARLSYVTTQNAKTNGVYVGNNSTNVAAGLKIEHAMILGNQGDGIYCTFSSDMFVGDQTEVEFNGGNGINIHDCGGARIQYSDISGNTDGILVGGVGTGSVSAYNIQIVGNILSSNSLNDIEVQGWDAAASLYVSQSNVINDNIFQGSTTHGANQYDAIKIQDSGYNAIVGNVVQDPYGMTFPFKNCLEIISVNGELPDTVSGNNFNTQYGIAATVVANTVTGANTFNGVAGPTTGALLLSNTVQFTNITGYSTGAGANQGVYNFNFYNPTQATSGQDYNTPFVAELGSYWGGSSPVLFGTESRVGFSGVSHAAAAQTFAVGTLPPGGLEYTFDQPILTGFGATKPTITGCGTISAQLGTSTAGQFVTSTTGICTAVIPLPSVSDGWTCLLQDTTQHAVANILIQSANTPTSCTVVGTTVAGDTITFAATPW